MSERTEYAFDFGDEIEDFTIDNGVRDDAEALRRSRSLITGRSTPEQVDLYEHTLVSRIVTITEGRWAPVELDHHDAADLISVEPS